MRAAASDAVRTWLKSIGSNEVVRVSEHNNDTRPDVLDSRLLKMSLDALWQAEVYSSTPSMSTITLGMLQGLDLAVLERQRVLREADTYSATQDFKVKAHRATEPW
jgi:hypothetical protein